MPRTTTAHNSIKTGPTTVERIEPIEAFHTQENPFENEDLVKLLDQVAIPVAHETVRKMLPHRVEHHIRRLLNSNDEADRKELFELMKGAKLNICFAVYHSVLQYAREASEAHLNGSSQESLPAASQEA